MFYIVYYIRMYKNDIKLEGNKDVTIRTLFNCNYICIKIGYLINIHV